PSHHLSSLFSTHPFPSPSPALTDPSTLSLHDALPICRRLGARHAPAARGRERRRGSTLRSRGGREHGLRPEGVDGRPALVRGTRDRKSTRLNSSHQIISYAVFCLKKKNSTRTLESHAK